MESHEDSSKDAVERSPLLRLPAELRVRIYNAVLEGDTIHIYRTAKRNDPNLVSSYGEDEEDNEDDEAMWRSGVTTPFTNVVCLHRAETKLWLRNMAPISNQVRCFLAMSGTGVAQVAKHPPSRLLLLGRVAKSMKWPKYSLMPRTSSALATYGKSKTRSVFTDQLFQYIAIVALRTSWLA